MDPNKIDKDTYYSLNEIFQMQALPWIKTFATLRNLVQKDIEQGGDKFKAIKTGEGEGTRYKIKGEHILDLISRMNSHGFDLSTGNE